MNPSFRQLETAHHLQERIFGLSCVNLFPDLSKNRSDARYGGDSEKTSLLAFVSAIADARNHESKGLFTWRWEPQVGNPPSRGRKKKAFTYNGGGGGRNPLGHRNVKVVPEFFSRAG